MLTKDDLEKTIGAIADELLKEQDRSNWREYGFLPSTHRLYALWRERGGQPFKRHEFEYALNEMEDTYWMSGGERLQVPSFSAIDNGRRWVCVPAVLWNCARAGASQEQRDYAVAMLEQLQADDAERIERLREMARGLGAMADALERGADGEQVIHIGEEWGLNEVERGTIEEGEMLFEDEDEVDTEDDDGGDTNVP